MVPNGFQNRVLNDSEVPNHSKQNMIKGLEDTDQKLSQRARRNHSANDKQNQFNPFKKIVL